MTPSVKCWTQGIFLIMGICTTIHSVVTTSMGFPLYSQNQEEKQVRKETKARNWSSNQQSFLRALPAQESVHHPKNTDFFYLIKYLIPLHNDRQIPMQHKWKSTRFAFNKKPFIFPTWPLGKCGISQGKGSRGLERKNMNKMQNAAWKRALCEVWCLNNLQFLSGRQKSWKIK